MEFTGTLDKCHACNKTVYFIDLLTADGITYHKSCFKYTHCKRTLIMSNYSSMDGVLYSRHILSSISRNLEISARISKQANLNDEVSWTPSKLSSLFSGTQDKCTACQKTVYPLEKVTMEEECFHKQCFKCVHAGCPLTHSSYASLDGTLYCKVHFAQLFMVKGTYSHVLEVVKQKTASQESETAAEEVEATHEDDATTEQPEAAEGAESKEEETTAEVEDKQEDDKESQQDS